MLARTATTGLGRQTRLAPLTSSALILVALPRNTAMPAATVLPFAVERSRCKRERAHEDELVKVILMGIFSAQLLADRIF